MAARCFLAREMLLGVSGNVGDRHGEPACGSVNRSFEKSRPRKVACEKLLGCCRSEGISAMTLLPLFFAAILYFNERPIANQPEAIQLEPEPAGEVSPFAAVADAAS